MIGSKSYLAFLLAILVVASGGCSTLSTTLGLSIGNPQSRLQPSAREISNAPGQSFLLPKELSRQTLPTYRIDVGDTVSIEAVDFESTVRLPGDQIVAPDGTISLGECGTYHIVNQTVQQAGVAVQEIIDRHLREKVEAEFANNRSLREGEFRERQLPAPQRQQEPLGSLEHTVAERIRRNQITVRLVDWDSKKYYVLGEVNSPGSFAYIGNETVLDAIVEAGGLTLTAQAHEIIVSRPTPCGSCRIVMKVCYDHIVQLGDASTNYQILPGDRVFVPHLTFVEDLRQSLMPQRKDRCPRCGPCPVGCNLPTGCEEGHAIPMESTLAPLVDRETYLHMGFE